MLEGWLTVQSFVAREGLEESNLSNTLGGTGIPSSPDAGAADTISVPNLSQIVGTVEDGLAFIVAEATDPDSALLGGNLRTTLWSDLDYRTSKMPTTACTLDSQCNAGLATPLRCDTTVSPSVCRLPYLSEAPQYQQRLGVPYFAIQALSAYSNLMAAYLQEVATQTFGQPADNSPSSARLTALNHYGTGMRLMLFIEQWANAINVTAGVDTVHGTCPGNQADCTAIAQQFNAAVNELTAVQGRLANAAQALQNSTNPFNIPEDDVPLFFGDPTGTNSQYFAASDYLLNGWAVPAVTQAQSYLDAARAAWITESQDAVQDELNQHNRQQEIDQLMSKYGAPVLANCGNLQVPDGQGGFQLLDDTQVIPYFADGTKTLSNEACYIDQTCGGGPQTLDQNTELRSLVNETFVDSSGNIIAGTGGQTAVQQFLSSEMCKIAFVGQYMSGDTFIKAMTGVCPGGGGCSIQRFTNDQSLYITNGSTHIPLAALFAPVAQKDIGAGNFYSAATDGPGTDSTNIYGYEDLRTDTTTITIKYASNGTPDTYKCVSLTNGTVPAGSHIVFPPAPPGEGGKPSSPIACSGSMGTPETPAVTSQVATEFGLTGTSQCAAKLGADHPKPTGTVLPASCYKGAMGVAFHQMQSDLLKIQDAQQVLQNGTTNATATEQLCQTEDTGIKDIMDLQSSYNQMVSDYQMLQAASGFWEGIVSFVGGIASNNIGTALSGFDQIVNTGVGISADAVQNEATSLSQMQENFGNSVTAQQCWNTFLAQRGDLVTAMTNIQIAVNDLGTQQEVLSNLFAQNALSINEGIAVLQQENASPVSSLGHQFWVDEKVEQFRKEFEWSRRLLYLAMRAVEYEFQESLPYRSQIVSAATPAQLQDVVIGLQGEEASRTINRRRPDEASVVLSLRDDVLAIPDNSSAPPGERNWTPAERFESRVGDSRYAYRDSQGNYLGQAIPFSLAPSGILETRCGERLWTATATIQGDGIEASAPGASVLLLKRNTFSSQYCSGKAPTTDSNGNPIPAQQMQIGVIHESADLFQPGSAVDLSDADEFTAALLYPWFNIPKTEFYATSYQNGSSQELAGRGLYGDYVLLFPQQVLSAGFALGNVEDVLLRFDYLSIDNLSQ